ncbi:hypothetical protein EON65_06880 [archaeon]|nr:MAG: hypothetical protein EON65_06880 [archaeon]
MMLIWQRYAKSVKRSKTKPVILFVVIIAYHNAFRLYRFACSVSVSSVPGIAKQKEMLLQGNFILDMETYLIDQYLLPRHVIEVKGLKSKKK